MKKHGFTLIELLVVVAIVALLISTLLPTLSRSRDTVRTTLCQSNMRQIAAGSASYAASNRGILPNYYVFESTWPQYDYSGFGQSWAWRLDQFLDNGGREMYRCPSFVPYPGKVPASIAGNDNLAQGWVYGTRLSFQAPASDRLYFRTDYALFYLGFSEVRNHPRQGYPNVNFLEKKAYSNGGPDQQPLIAESRHLYQYSAVSSLKYMQYSVSDYNRLLAATYDPETSPTTNTGVFAFSTLHSRGSNLPYADGHVQRWTRDDLFAQKPF